MPITLRDFAGPGLASESGLALKPAGPDQQ
jgi:hypothetical protein